MWCVTVYKVYVCDTKDVTRDTWHVTCCRVEAHWATVPALGNCHTALVIISTRRTLDWPHLDYKQWQHRAKPHLLTISIQPHSESYDNFCSHLGIIIRFVHNVDYVLIWQTIFYNAVSPFLMQSCHVTSDIISMSCTISPTISSALLLPSHQC